MFDTLIKRSYYAKKHMEAPLLAERIQYVQRWIDGGYPRSTVTSVAQYLLRIVELIPLPTDHIITLKEVELAASKWASYKSNHPQKRAAYSKTAAKKFRWFAIDWLKKMNCLEPLPEEKYPLFVQLFSRGHALRRHVNAPLLKERLEYLDYWVNNGASLSYLHCLSQYLLIAINLLKLYELRIVTANEIEAAANIWAHNDKIRLRKNGYSKFARMRFIRDTSNWLNMLGYLEHPVKKIIPFGNYLDQYVYYMRSEQGLSENTIMSRIATLKNFLFKLNHMEKDFNAISPLSVDDILTSKYKDDGYSRRTVQGYATVIRGFLKYAGNMTWCSQNLWETIHVPRVYRYEQLPYSPSWDDVKNVLASINSNNPTDIRDYAICMLLAIYGLRRSEVSNLCLDDIDWKNEMIYLKRAKGSKPQTFPLIKSVGDAILKYIKQARPNNCQLRQLFVCRIAPYRPLNGTTIYQIVSKRLKPVAPSIKHYGPHALRHACATHLINEGVTLKEISDQLGHQGLDTTRIYSKVDLTNLRKVADMNWEDVI